MAAAYARLAPEVRETLSKLVEYEMSIASVLSLSSTKIARGLIADIGEHCWDGRGNMLTRVYRAIREHLKDLPRDDTRRWSQRRVRAFWERETDNIRFNEVVQLAYVAERVKEQRQGRDDENADYIQQISALADALLHKDAHLDSRDVEALRKALERQDAANPRRDPAAGGAD